MTVYVLINGPEFDAYVIGVYSSRGAASHIAAKKKLSEPIIKEFDVDEGAWKWVCARRK